MISQCDICYPWLQLWQLYFSYSRNFFKKCKLFCIWYPTCKPKIPFNIYLYNNKQVNFVYLNYTNLLDFGDTCGVCVSAELSSRSNRRFCQRNAMLWRCIRRHEWSAFDNSCQHELFLCLMWAYLIVINCYKWIGSVINT